MSQSEEVTEYKGFAIVVHREGSMSEWTACANPSNQSIDQIPINRFGIGRVGGAWDSVLLDHERRFYVGGQERSLK